MHIINVEMIIQDGRNWVKIPWGTQSTNGSTSATYFWTNNTSYQTFGSVSNGNLQRDGSNRFHNDNESSGPNVNSKQVSHDTGILYRYSRVYCTAVQSHTASGGGIPNPDWGAEGTEWHIPSHRLPSTLPIAGARESSATSLSALSGSRRNKTYASSR